jgi:hypothetical protein
MKERAKKVIVETQRSNITPVFLPKEENRMTSIVERDED